MTSQFKIGMPEEAGIPSKAILKFIEYLKESQVEIHGFYMQHKETCIAEVYYAPFHKDFQHRMYSISKSLTSLAIGLLQAEGKLNLEDFIFEYFKDKCPEKDLHPYIKEMTIKDMLMMTTAHQSTTYKRYGDGDWVESFFKVTPTHKPGMVFNYDTSSAHVLAALVERLTGKELMAYLREKFWDEMNCSEEAEFIKDPFGVSQGGSGLICTMRDIASVAYLCTNEGKYKEKQLLPQNYLKEAISKKVCTHMQPFLDEKFGYGYQIWQNRKDGFTFYGMGGQLAVCFPRFHFFIVITANTIGNPADLQQIYNAFYECIYPYLECPTSIVDKEVQCKMKAEVDNLKLTPVGEGIKKNISELIKGNIYELQPNPMKIKWIKFEKTVSGGKITYEKGGKEQSISFGYESYEKEIFPDTDYECISSGGWVDTKTLFIKTVIIEKAFSTLKIQIDFEQEYITLTMKKGIEESMKSFDGIACGVLK